MTRTLSAVLLVLLAGVPTPAATAGEPDGIYEIDIAEAPYRGPSRAAVTIVEFSDYQ